MRTKERIKTKDNLVQKKHLKKEKIKKNPACEPILEQGLKKENS